MKKLKPKHFSDFTAKTLIASDSKRALQLWMYSGVSGPSRFVVYQYGLGLDGEIEGSLFHHFEFALIEFNNAL